MKKKHILFILFGGAFLLLFLFCLLIFFPNRKAEDEIDTSFLLPFIQDGDLLLRLGDGPLSSRFRKISLTDRRFSHLGIVRIRDGNITIINAVGSVVDRERGVEEVTLQHFLSFAKSIGVFRVKSLDGSFISDKSLDYVGRSFDWNFDLDDDEYIYCTELIYAILKQAGHENILQTYFLDQIKKDVITLESITLSSDIEEIIYIEIREK